MWKEGEERRNKVDIGVHPLDLQTPFSPTGLHSYYHELLEYRFRHLSFSGKISSQEDVETMT